ncbi:MAG: hypothetical protein LC662_06600 [Rhodothermaceae bacterium]|nr:hypothetical protein [Rhodothermaceae bacterium]
MKLRLILSLLSLVFLCTLIPFQKAAAQGLRIIATNTAMGALNGAMLGGASMAIANSNDLRPLRFGVGFGTIAGLGLGIYDFSQSQGGVYTIDGVFNRANYTSQIILMDTFYGAVIGTLVGTAATLIMDEKLIYGLQYGVGAGTWVGFAFGLVDAFAISRGPTEFRYEDFDDYSSAPSRQSGMIQMQVNSGNSIGFGDIAFGRFPDLSVNGNHSQISAIVTVASWQIRF